MDRHAPAGDEPGRGRIRHAALPDRGQNRPGLRPPLGIQVGRRAVVAGHLVAIAAVLDGVLQVLAEAVCVGDHEPVAAGAAEMLLVGQAAAQRKASLLLPAVRHVVPPAVEEILRAGAVNRRLTVDRRPVVALEVQRLPGFQPLRLQDASDQVAPAPDVGEGEGPAGSGRVLPPPQGIKAPLAGRPAHGRDRRLRGEGASLAAGLFGHQLDLHPAVKRHRQVAVGRVARCTQQKRRGRRPAPGVAEEIPRRTENRRLRLVVVSHPQKDIALPAGQRPGGAQTQTDQPAGLLRGKQLGGAAGLEAHFATQAGHLGPRRGGEIGNILSGGGQETAGLAQVGLFLSVGDGLEGPHRHVRRAHRVVDLIELQPLGPDHDPAGPLKPDRHIAEEAAGAETRQRGLEGRLPAGKQVAELQRQTRRGLVVEEEVHRVVGRRGRPDAGDDPRTLQVGDYQTAGFPADEGIGPGEPVIVAAGAVVTRYRSDADHRLERRQQVQPGQGLGTDRVRRLAPGRTARQQKHHRRDAP